MDILGTEIEIVKAPYSNSVAPIDKDYEDSTPSLMIKGRWNKNLVKYIKDNNFKGLYLNYTKGFTCDNFDFLYELKELELLSVVYTPVENLKQIETLYNLRTLSISCHWSREINFSSLHNLKRCFISFGRGAETIFKCTSLRYLYIDNFKLKDFSALINLSQLEYLTIGNSNFNQAEVLEKLALLRKISLLNCRKLNSLPDFVDLINLEWLNVDGSRKLASITELSNLKSLDILQLSNNKILESLSPIKHLSGLKALSFYGDTCFEDGNFHFLEDFADLSMVGFNGRKHYTHKPSTAWDWSNFGIGVNSIIKK